MFRRVPNSIILQGHYRINYPSETEQTRDVPIVRWDNIADWSSGSELRNAAISWTGLNEMGTLSTVYVTRWDNPMPDIMIESIDFIGEFKSCLGLIAITLEE